MLTAMEQCHFTGTLYRKVKVANRHDFHRNYENYREDYAVGKLVTFGPRFSGTANDMLAAFPRYHDELYLLFQFINTRGVYISHLSGIDEKEVLIDPQSVFRVVAQIHVEGRDKHYDEQQQWVWVGGVVIITLEQVLDTP